MGRLIEDVSELLTEQFQYRELLYRLTQRDLTIRYKQTVMGLAWALFMPLINTAVFSVIFVRVARIHTTVPYPLFAYIGLLSWSFFASSLRFSVISLTSNATLLTKVFFPREIFPLSAVLVCLVDFFVGGIVLVGMMIYYHMPFSPALAFLPVIIVVQFIFTAGVAMFLAMANLFFRDVKYVFEIILTVWMFASSVVYPIGLVGPELAPILRLNPMTPIIEGYRAVILGGRLPNPVGFLAATVVSIVTLSCVWLVFHRAEFRFAESV
jgi:ABC-type polysaccharide/polyol phosphate export permease